MIITTLALSLTLSHQGPEPELTAADICPRIGGLAENIMQGRQEGVSMSAMMAVVPDGQGSTDALEGIAREMVLQAYQTTRWHTERNRRREAEDYRAQWELICYEHWNERGS